MLGFSRLELGVGWFGNYDSYDLAALNLLSHGPTVSQAIAGLSTEDLTEN
jgi:hypothetical protein